MAGLPVIRVYEKPSCVQCTQTKRLMDRLGLEYEVEDVTEPDNLAAAQELGHTSAPVVVVGAESWAGFRPDLINALAERIEGNEG